MKLKVSEAVLIPRPETEELVLAANTFISQRNSSVLDIGTGSGCIAIAIKRNNPATIVSAVDSSADALAIAKENASAQGVNITFIEKDFLDENAWKDMGSYDVIISNPPYIPLMEKERLDQNVTGYEPHIALFVADDEPLIFYKKIAAFGKLHLTKGGNIFMETHEAYAHEVASHFQQQGYNAVVKKDMFEKERMVVAGFSKSLY